MGDGDVIWTWIAHTWIIHYLHTIRTQYELLHYLNYISFRVVFNGREYCRKSTRHRNSNTQEFKEDPFDTEEGANYISYHWHWDLRPKALGGRS